MCLRFKAKKYLQNDIIFIVHTLLIDFGFKYNSSKVFSHENIRSKQKDDDDDSRTYLPYRQFFQKRFARKNKSETRSARNRKNIRLCSFIILSEKWNKRRTTAINILVVPVRVFRRKLGYLMFERKQKNTQIAFWYRSKKWETEKIWNDRCYVRYFDNDLFWGKPASSAILRWCFHFEWVSHSSNDEMIR